MYPLKTTSQPKNKGTFQYYNFPADFKNLICFCICPSDMVEPVRLVRFLRLPKLKIWLGLQILERNFRPIAINFKRKTGFELKASVAQASKVQGSHFCTISLHIQKKDKDNNFIVCIVMYIQLLCIYLVMYVYKDDWGKKFLLKNCAYSEGEKINKE